MSQTPNRAVIYLTGDKTSRVTISVEEGERVATDLSSGDTHTVEVRRLDDGARVVIRTAAIVSVAFERAEERRAPRLSSVGGYVAG